MDLVKAFVDNFSLIASLYIANYFLALICAVRELMISRTSQGSIAWLIALIILPFPTTFIYLIFGWKAFDDYAQSQSHSGRKWRLGRTHDFELFDKEAGVDWPVLKKVSEMPFLNGNVSNLLIDGEATFASIIEGISRAQDYILFQFYIIRDDDLGQKIAAALIERAKKGVRVYFLYDDVGSNKLGKEYKQNLKNNGIQVFSFNHRHAYLRIFGLTRINYRNHRKNIVVDGREAWVGGHNVGNEYLGLDPKFGRWRDTHVHLVGPAAIACALMFKEDWQWATGEDIVESYPNQIATPGDQSVLVMPTGPADSLEDCSIAFTEVISRARHKLWIVSPYFVPGIEAQTALYAAALRGVDVRILIPDKPDHKLVWLASHAHADLMINHGVKVYRYTDGFLHQKAILCDDQIAGIGTVNFDYRSFNINFEVTLWFTGSQMITKIENMLKQDFADSRLSTRTDLRKRNMPFRLICQAAKLFSPIL